MAASPAYFQAHDANVKTLLPGDFSLQAFEQRAGKLLDPPTLEARQVNMIDIGLGFVKVLLAIQMHQVELVDQPQFLEKFNGPVHCCAIDLAVALLRQRQQGRGIQVPVRLLNRFEQDPPLAGDADAAQR